MLFILPGWTNFGFSDGYEIKQCWTFSWLFQRNGYCVPSANSLSLVRSFQLIFLLIGSSKRAPVNTGAIDCEENGTTCIYSFEWNNECPTRMTHSLFDLELICSLRCFNKSSNHSSIRLPETMNKWNICVNVSCQILNQSMNEPQVQT